MDKEEVAKRILGVSKQHGMVLQAYLPLKSGVQCILLGSYCPSKLFTEDFRRISKRVWQVNNQTAIFLRKSKKFLRREGYKKVWSRGVFSFYGDLRPLAQAAGWGEYGENGLIVNEKWGTDFLITAIFFK